MKRFVIDLELKSPTFQNPADLHDLMFRRHVVAHILREVAARVEETGLVHFPIIDNDGNIVGKTKIPPR